MQLDKDVVESLVLQARDVGREPSHVVKEVQQGVVADALRFPVEQVRLHDGLGVSDLVAELACVELTINSIAQCESAPR